jgi:hypothetical protein
MNIFYKPVEQGEGGLLNNDHDDPIFVMSNRVTAKVMTSYNIFVLFVIGVWIIVCLQLIGLQGSFTQSGIGSVYDPSFCKTPGPDWTALEHVSAVNFTPDVRSPVISATATLVARLVPTCSSKNVGNSCSLYDCSASPGLLQFLFDISRMFKSVIYFTSICYIL